jgi:glutaredoxin
VLQRLRALLSRKQSTPLEICFYTRQGCCLCDDAWATLTRISAEFGITPSSVDVDSIPELKMTYGDDVPVVTIGGKVRFRGHVNAVLLRRLLRAEMRGS